MQQRKSLIVANWKMHLGMHQASLFAHKLADKVKTHQGVEVVLAPTSLVLQSLSLQVNRRQFKLAAQNCYWRDEGAFTGEVSAAMLRGIADYVIVGHSERRHVFGERDRDITNKVQAVIRNKMKPILCIGETAHERADGETSHVLHDQLVGGLLNVVSDEIEDVIIAYEPVWAIGTGNNASPNDVENAVKLIRKQIKALYGVKAADEVTVLYGGSSNAHNATDYLKLDGVNGLLVGGASLKADEFASIVEQAHQTQAKKGNDK
ncbi:MAG TPA: triose-phosphate isomerase [Candidatus Saccharimonadales bacterium]|nr:triose-phosphate isomerase [Candidatus Saccharimonadales bacterium]